MSSPKDTRHRFLPKPGRFDPPQEWTGEDDDDAAWREAERSLEVDDEKDNSDDDGDVPA